MGPAHDIANRIITSPPLLHKALHAIERSAHHSV